jgi:hypothetical protein
MCSSTPTAHPWPESMRNAAAIFEALPAYSDEFWS